MCTEAAAVKCEAFSEEVPNHQVFLSRRCRAGLLSRWNTAPDCLGRWLLFQKNLAYLFDPISAAGPHVPTWCSRCYAAQIRWNGGSFSELIWGKEGTLVYIARGSKICAASMLISTRRSRDGPILMSVPSR